MRGLGAAVAAFLLVLALPAAAAAGTRPTKPCKDDRTARCGSIRVPLFRGVPGGGGQKLRVHFRVYPRTDRSRPALEPIVGAEGGPGYPSIDSAESYLFMLGSLRRRHDLIVMDNRGTGRSGAINCPRLQAGKGVYSREVGRCARKLGRAANAYGTGAAADDLAAVLDKLGVPVVNIYGDSYGTYFSQAFAVRHPERVRAVVLDAAFAVDGYDPWIREESVQIRYAWTEICHRSADCSGDVLAALEPLRATARGQAARGHGARRRRRPASRSGGRLRAGPDDRRRLVLLHDLSRPVWRRSAPWNAATALRCCAWPPRTCPSPGAGR